MTWNGKFFVKRLLKGKICKIMPFMVWVTSNSGADFFPFIAKMKQNRKIMRNFSTFSFFSGSSNLINSRNNETSDYPWFIFPVCLYSCVERKIKNCFTSFFCRAENCWSDMEEEKNFMWPLCKFWGEAMNNFEAEFNYRQFSKPQASTNEWKEKQQDAH